MGERGTYMYLTDPAKLRDWMTYRSLSYAELGRAAGVSRQFVHQLATGHKRTCRPKTARLIEKFLLPPQDRRSPGDGPLFVARYSDPSVVPSDSVGG